jgi:hypothetical protein
MTIILTPQANSYFLKAMRRYVLEKMNGMHYDLWN